jgi:hypothetical protein
MDLSCRWNCRHVSFIAGYVLQIAPVLRCRFLAFLLLVGSTFFCSAVASPWVDTEDLWLRADIERLSRAGLIDLPINSYPLMWSGIMEQLNGVEPRKIQSNLVDAYFRISKAGHRALDYGSTQTVQLAAMSERIPIRHYGDQLPNQDGLQFTWQATGANFAYKLRFNKSANHELAYDNSYLATTLGNWALILGAVDKWWGPGWNSSVILSNNARPTPGLMLQRNYSDPYSLPVLRRLGPWTASAFISELDDDRHIKDAKLLGFTFGFKPTPELEINLRRTMQWGGEGRPESIDNLVKLLLGNADNCDTQACRLEEPGNQLAAIDISWYLPLIGSSLYVQTVGEDEAGYMPSRSSRQYGITRDIAGLGFNGSIFLEFDNTTTVTYSSHYNILYNHSIYRTGYRYQGRAIGATWDNDSKLVSIGMMGWLANGDAVKLGATKGRINIDSINGSASKHSITTRGGDFSELSAKWRRPFSWGYMELGGYYAFSFPDDYRHQSDRLNFSARIKVNF